MTDFTKKKFTIVSKGKGASANYRDAYDKAFARPKPNAFRVLWERLKWWWLSWGVTR